MMKRIHYIIIAILLVLMAASCEYSKMPLPVANSSSSGFGANDTSYVELNPVWDATFLGNTLSHPTDITIGPDGYIFIADEGNDRILVVNQSGEQMTQNGLGNLNNIPAPSGIHIDAKLNLYATNGSNTVYAWNQYFNTVSIDSVSDRIVIKNYTTGDTLHVTLAEAYSGEDAFPGYQFQSILFEGYSADKHPIRDVYTFYKDTQAGTQINDITSIGDDLYATDSGNQRIIKIALIPAWFVKTSEEFVLLHYRGAFSSNAVTYGSGAGTVDTPWSIVSDDDNIYFSQLAGNFLVQKLSAEDFTSQFTLYQDAIMDLNRFVEPRAIALDETGDLFVMDTGSQKVQKFFNTGTRAGQVADLGERGIAVTEFNDARGLMVSDQVIYVVESGENRIRRFQYSISDEDIPDDEKQP